VTHLKLICPFTLRFVKSRADDLDTLSRTAIGLSKITAAQVSDAMQVSESNPMTGIEGRAQLLIRLASVLTAPSNAAYFSQNGSQRPGHIIDYLLSHPTSQAVPSPVMGRKVAVKIETMWEIVVEGLSGVWPAARTKIDGISLGDVWPVDCLKKQETGDGEELVSFHKLSQWMTYSLIEVSVVRLSISLDSKNLLLILF